MRIHSLGRMARLSRLPLSLTRQAAVAGGLKVLGRLTDESALELHERTADQLFEILGGLKGGAMKFGQVLSVYEAVLPPAISAVYRERLSRLQAEAHPEAAAVARKVLEEDLGPAWGDYFTSFEDDAAAAASLGQVHRAVWRDGRTVAVKVQYPEARADLLGDRDAVVLAMRVFTRLVAPGMDGKALANELMDRIAEELDYEREAEAQRAFREGFRDDPDFLVPDVLLQRGRVLVSEWIGGTPLAHVIADGTQEERDRAGLLLTRLMFAGIPRTGLMHGDPHPGNFRLMEDGGLGVLDFGAMYRHEEGAPSPMEKWMRIHLAADADELLSVLRELEFLRPGVEADGERLLESFARSGVPANVETFRFDGDFLRVTLDGMTSSMPVGLSLAFPPDFVHAQRAIGVGIGVLCQLEAEVPFQSEALRWL